MLSPPPPAFEDDPMHRALLGLAGHARVVVAAVERAEESQPVSDSPDPVVLALLGANATARALLALLDLPEGLEEAPTDKAPPTGWLR